MRPLLRFETTPGAPATAPRTWPAGAVPRDPARPTLVILAHPRCSCTRATLAELARLMARLHGRVAVQVLFFAPMDRAGWERTSLWDAAAAIPGVTPHSDPDGAQARLFGSLTSGQALLYAAAGTLRFSGGLTPARGSST